MADTYSDTLTEVMYSAMERIQQEPVGFLQAVERNKSNVTQVSFGTSIQSLKTGDVTITTANTYTPTMIQTTTADVADTVDTLALNTYIKFEFPILPEHILHANNTVGWDTQLGRRILKGMRGARNAVEALLAEALANGSSRATGTAGTTPFASNTDILEDAMQIIVDNGGNRYGGDLSVVMNTAAGSKLRKLTNLQKVNEAGNAELLRRGILLDLNGFSLRESAGIVAKTKGAGVSYVTNGTFAVGDTTIAIDGGTVNSTGFKTGDVVVFEDDTNKYVVKTGLTATSGNIVLNGPGLRQALADGKTATIGNNYTPNMAFASEAAEIASRAPLLGDDMAKFHGTITDDVSGLAWSYSLYPGVGMRKAVIQSFFGFKVWNPYLVATILG